MPAASAISCVGIDEGHPEQRRQPLADAGLARAHQPDQHDRPRSRSFAAGAGSRVTAGLRWFDHRQLPSGRAQAKVPREAIAAAGPRD